MNSELVAKRIRQNLQQTVGRQFSTFIFVLLKINSKFLVRHLLPPPSSAMKSTLLFKQACSCYPLFHMIKLCDFYIKFDYCDNIFLHSAQKLKKFEAMRFISGTTYISSMGLSCDNA